MLTFPNHVVLLAAVPTFVILLLGMLLSVAKKKGGLTLLLTGTVLLLMWMFAIGTIASSMGKSVVVVIDTKSSAVSTVANGRLLWTPSVKDGREWFVVISGFRLKGTTTDGQIAADYDLDVAVEQGNEMTFIAFSRRNNLFSDGGHYLRQDALKAYLRGVVDTTVLPPRPAAWDDTVKALGARGLTLKDNESSTIRIYLKD